MEARQLICLKKIQTGTPVYLGYMKTVIRTHLSNDGGVRSLACL